VLFGGIGRGLIVRDEFDGDVDGEHAFAGSFHDDRVEVERAEAPGIGNRELAQPDQQVRQSLDVTTWAAARAFQQFGAFGDESLPGRRRG
jgi:hypothetical protein